LVMSSRIPALAILAAGLFGLTHRPIAAEDAKPKPEDMAKAKKALQEVQDFIGLWNLEGTRKVGGRTEAWKEKVSWGWKFKDGDAWMTVDFAEGKGRYFKNGTLKYNIAKKRYLLALMSVDRGEQVFEGELAKGALKLESKDAKTGDVSRLTMNTLAEGIRFQMKYEKQDGGRGLFSSIYAMNGNKDGESIAGTKKKPECIVSGGAASIAVSYQGKTYYCCCTGCRDEFNANPEKYIKAAKK
jgi:YHS domain-containing protein